ncbi:hypothetical protein [Micromonospora sp. NBC_01796]|uniref:hypothetical protein n=1 Tax=Micromonospora sp. NBC_01796 TaxID=2975987 RepID=UPI002DD99AC6|nr:hypothetical protein [Micromonospora sp. NBC_01796]WSA86904.1 hypothetical protein OIE47_04600 [Micromonospora sp. NBC_01796]
MQKLVELLEGGALGLPGRRGDLGVLVVLAGAVVGEQVFLIGDEHVAAVLGGVNAEPHHAQIFDPGGDSTGVGDGRVHHRPSLVLTTQPMRRRRVIATVDKDGRAVYVLHP